MTPEEQKTRTGTPEDAEAVVNAPDGKAIGCDANKQVPYGILPGPVADPECCGCEPDKEICEDCDEGNPFPAGDSDEDDVANDDAGGSGEAVRADELPEMEGGDVADISEGSGIADAVDDEPSYHDFHDFPDEGQDCDDCNPCAGACNDEDDGEVPGPGCLDALVNETWRVFKEEHPVMAARIEGVVTDIPGILANAVREVGDALGRPLTIREEVGALYVGLAMLATPAFLAVVEK